jgi:hypothetical protein
LPPVGWAWVVVGGRLSIAVARRADVKLPLGIVMACQILWRIGTARAQLDSHVLPPRAKQKASSPIRTSFADGALT